MYDQSPSCISFPLFNGFFINKLHKSHSDLELKDVSSCFENEKVKFGMLNRWPRTKNMDWITV